MEKTDIGGNKPVIWLALVILFLAGCLIANTQFHLVDINLPAMKGTKPEITYGSLATILGVFLLVAGFRKC